MIDIGDLLGNDQSPQPRKVRSAQVDADRAARRARIEAQYREAQSLELEVAPPDRPDSTLAQRQEAVKNGGIGRCFVEAGEIRKPVSKSWLAEALQMSPDTVAKRLSKCPSLGMAGGQRPVYDFKTAVRYLLPPLMDLGEYIQCLRPQDLPNEINKVFFEGQRQRIKFEQEAGESWATTDVLDVFGEVFMRIKDSTQLFTETMRDRAALTDAQYVMLKGMMDGFQEDLHAKLVAIPAQRQTRSRIAVIDTEIDAGE